MKIAIISDTHLGDPLCTLVEKKGDSFIAGRKYKEFKDAAGTKNDYLILLGDILDFSVTSYQNAYEYGKAFFTMIQKDKIADQYIYVPGNHDYGIWSVVENEVNIIYQIKNGRLPRRFRMSVPGIIDDRKNSRNKGFTLPGVEIRTSGNFSYGGLFLDNITKNFDSNSNSITGKDSHFIFTYPNIYMVTDNESILITHGHYLEAYWSILSEWTPRVFKSDLRIGTAMDIGEMVGINFPMNQLACSGVGQAGLLTNVLSNVQFQIKRGDLKKAKEYLNNLDDYLDDNVFEYKWYQFINEALTDTISNKVKDAIIDIMSSHKETRYNETFFNSDEVRKRFINYYNASLVELDNIKRFNNIIIPPPETIIFGHTHEPVPWNDKDAPKEMPTAGKVVRLFNSGGWLMKEEDNEKVFCGAEVFKYETNKGFSSISIR